MTFIDFIRLIHIWCFDSRIEFCFINFSTKMIIIIFNAKFIWSAEQVIWKSGCLNE